MKKYFEWFKSNWFPTIMLIALAIMAWRLYFFDTTYESLFKDNVKQSELFHQQLKELEQVNTVLMVRQKTLEENYKKEILVIKEDYQNKIDDINLKIKQKQQKTVKQYKEDPVVVAEQFKTLFDIPTVVK